MRWTIAGVGIPCAFWIAIGLEAGANEPVRNDGAVKEGVCVRLVDPMGAPVEGAEVGLDAASGNVNFRETGWEYVYGPARSDDKGMARLNVDPRLLNGLSLTARHRAKHLIVVEDLDPEQIGKVPSLTMRNECRVTGRLRCSELEGMELPLRGVVVNARLGAHLAAEYWSMEPNFELFLPPGKYNLEFRSELSGTHSIVRPLAIPDGVQRLELYPIELHRTEHARLTGRQAPELREVVSWKNGPPGKLADLKGKVILLDFWGWWCGACVQRMPALFGLYDKYRDQGLIIIGIHVDYDEENGVATTAELERKLTAARKSIWKGRDIPFPVALTTSRIQGFGEDAARSALCAAAVDYGIENYPTMILIDRRGRVVGRVDERDYIKRIEAALSDR
jgi:thiol-disulfide isomerase/thioredoxin